MVTSKIFVEKHRPYIEVRKCWARQIVESAEYIHTMGVRHSDFRLEEWLLDETLNARLSDFNASGCDGNVEIGLEGSRPLGPKMLVILCRETTHMIIQSSRTCSRLDLRSTNSLLAKRRTKVDPLNRLRIISGKASSLASMGSLLVILLWVVGSKSSDPQKRCSSLATEPTDCEMGYTSCGSWHKAALCFTSSTALDERQNIDSLSFCVCRCVCACVREGYR
jgi:serine/threonine protein kinase